MAFYFADADTSSDEAPRYARRLSDKILSAFHRACDEHDIEVAQELLNILEVMANRPPNLPHGNDRRGRESLVAAHERLWHMQHPGAGAQI
jgi:hypothetical protein